MGITVLLILPQRRDSLNLKERKTPQRSKALPHFRDSAGLTSTIRDKDDDFCSPVLHYPGMHCRPNFIRSYCKMPLLKPRHRCTCTFRSNCERHRVSSSSILQQERSHHHTEKRPLKVSRPS